MDASTDLINFQSAGMEPQRASALAFEMRDASVGTVSDSPVSNEVVNDAIAIINDPQLKTRNPL